MKVESVTRGASGAATVAVGGSSFIVDPAQLEELGLPPSALAAGEELGEGDLETLRLAAEAREAERRGLALVARAEQSAFMLGRKLEARGFSSRVVRLAVGRLESLGFLDDGRFARAYAASRLSRRSSKPEGPASIEAVLRERGVDRKVAEEAIAEVLGPDERAAALLAAAEKLILKAGHGRLGARGGKSFRKAPRCPIGEGDGDLASESPREEVRRNLRALGFASEEISDLLDSLAL